MRLVAPASTRSIDRAIALAAADAPTFDPGNLEGELAARYEHDRRVGVVGHGADDFAAAASALRAWAAHDVLGVQVFPARSPVALGATYLVTFGTPLLAIAAPCRVADVVDTPRRYGFTYVTLRGHPEEGEESFVLELDALGDVRFTIEARSRPRSALLRATAPVNRLVQHYVARGYLRAMQRHVRRRARPGA